MPIKINRCILFSLNLLKKTDIPAIPGIVGLVVPAEICGMSKLGTFNGIDSTLVILLSI